MLNKLSLGLFFMSLCFITSESCEATKTVREELEPTEASNHMPKPPNFDETSKQWIPAAPFKDPNVRIWWIAKANQEPDKYQMRGNELFIYQ